MVYMVFSCSIALLLYCYIVKWFRLRLIVSRCAADASLFCKYDSQLWIM